MKLTKAPNKALHLTTIPLHSKMEVISNIAVKSEQEALDEPAAVNRRQVFAEMGLGGIIEPRTYLLYRSNIGIIEC